MSKAAEIDIVSVSKIYGSTTAVHSISLKIPAGSYCCFLGPSGCGKTSTLRMIAGHESISSGDLRLGNVVVTDFPPAKRNTAMMFQSYALFPHLDLVDNVAFSLKMKGVDRDARRAKALDMLKLMQMEAYGSRRPAQLSGGQQQRVAIARALAMQPIALLCDEITSALDPELVAEVLAVVRELAAEGMTLLMVTHEMKFARDVCSRVVFMHQGRVHEVGRPDEVFVRPQTPELKQFLGLH